MRSDDAPTDLAPGEPFGIVTALDAKTNSEITVTTTGTFDLAQLYRLHEAVPARFRPNSTWAANVTNINRVRRFGAHHRGVTDGHHHHHEQQHHGDRRHEPLRHHEAADDRRGDPAPVRGDQRPASGDSSPSAASVVTW